MTIFDEILGRVKNLSLEDKEDLVEEIMELIQQDIEELPQTATPRAEYREQETRALIANG